MKAGWVSDTQVVQWLWNSELTCVSNPVRTHRVEKPATPLQLVRTEEESWMRDDTSSGNWNTLPTIQHLDLPWPRWLRTFIATDWTAWEYLCFGLFPSSVSSAFFFFTFWFVNGVCYNISGNAAIIKPSEVSSHSAKVMEELLPQYLDKVSLLLCLKWYLNTKHSFDHYLHLLRTHWIC